eukprot:TRINITY_DN4124_c0_g1_i2.p1 TRINITY_DN4124_c0_g1~~TRINITY_DN4124_c0_g1_i2.p1  ORF type:complete len:104 (-),score=12.25 TRINITY_DN4124_c0_g1_i2:103-414(-)
MREKDLSRRSSPLPIGCLCALITVHSCSSMSLALKIYSNLFSGSILTKDYRNAEVKSLRTKLKEVHETRIHLQKLIRAVAQKKIERESKQLSLIHSSKEREDI